MKHIYIINPVAGKGKKQQDIIERIQNLYRQKNLDYEIYITKFKGDAKAYVKKKCKEYRPYVFYACGGDGTLHEVINGAANFEHVVVGHIPCGTGNDFVKNFSRYYNFNDIDAQIKGEGTFVDLIKIKDEYAASVCNMGLDADAAFNMHKFKKIPFATGGTCYILSVLYCLMKNLGKNFEVELDNGVVIKDKFLLGVVANGHSYGGGYKCAPLAKINDGMLDICLVKYISRFKILSLISSYKAGTHLNNEKIKKHILYKKSRKVKIKSENPINLCIDGESFIYNEVDFEIMNYALKFWIPEGSSI